MLSLLPRISILFVFFLCYLSSFSQIKLTREQAFKRLGEDGPDTFRVRCLMEYGDMFYEDKIDTAKKYFEAALDLYNDKCSGLTDRHSQLLLAAVMHNVGYALNAKGKTDQAIDYYFKALKIRQQYNDSSGIAYTSLVIGNVFNMQEKYDEALKYFLECEKIFEALHDYNGLAIITNNLGYVYSVDDNAKAIIYFEKCIEYNRKISDNSSMLTAINNIGMVYYNEGNYEKAIEYYKQGIKISEQMKDYSTISLLLYNTGMAYKKKGDSVTGNKYILEALDVARKSHIPSASVRPLFALYKESASKKKYKEALDYYVEYRETRDSIERVENEKVLNDKQLEYDYEKKMALDSIRVEEERKITDLKIREQQQQKLTLYVVLGLVVAFLLFVFNRLKVTRKQKNVISEQKEEVTKQKELIEEHRKEIIDSIHYAKRIQDTLLASKEFVDGFLTHNFIFFNPKDIVSGDFYWAARHGDYFFLTASDSTGHGVPGAFMSLLNIGFMTEAINEKGIVDPAEVFNYTRKRLIASMSKEGQKDGFDGILIRYDLVSKELIYAAANNKPVLVSGDEIIVLPADKMPVGYGERKEDFQTHKIDYKPGDTVFLYTDGFADQFGGPKGKKFKYKPLDEFLKEGITEDLQNQHDRLKNKFLEWKGDLEQVDDVCIIGIRL